MRQRWFLIIGGILMMLLGLARGAGGLVLLVRGPAADSKIVATSSTAGVLGAMLLVLGLALVAAAIGVLRRQRLYWLIGILCTVLFVVDGAINGALLYGSPGAGGTAVNVLAAALILVCLFVGKTALRKQTE